MFCTGPCAVLSHSSRDADTEGSISAQDLPSLSDDAGDPICMQDLDSKGVKQEEDAQHADASEGGEGGHHPADLQVEGVAGSGDCHQHAAYIASLSMKASLFKADADTAHLRGSAVSEVEALGCDGRLSESSTFASPRGMLRLSCASACHYVLADMMLCLQVI